MTHCNKVNINWL